MGNRWGLKIETRKLIEAQENAEGQFAIGFRFESDWSRKRCGVSGPITELSKAKPKQSRFVSTLDSQNENQATARTQFSFRWPAV